MTKDRSALYTGIVTVATVIMGVLPHINNGVDVILTSVLLTVISIFTIKKQRTSIEINDSKAVLYTWVLVIIAACGGLNDMLGQLDLKEVHYFSTQTSQILKKSISGLILILNVFSKQWFPTAEGKTIQGIKIDMKENIQQEQSTQ